MPNFPWRGQDASAIEDAALAAMLSGPDMPEDLAAGLQPAADVLAALRARPSGDELAGEAFAMAEFRNRAGMPDPVRRTRPRRRRALVTSLMSAKVAMAAAAVAITVGGVATAAFAGALPAPAQRLAHDVIGAPAEHRAPHSSGQVTATHRTGSHDPFRRHFRWNGCVTPKRHPASKASAHPSWTPGPHPTPTCAPGPHASKTPHPAKTPAPHPSRMPGKHRHHRHVNRFPHEPEPRSTGSPAPQPSPAPDPPAQG